MRFPKKIQSPSKGLSSRKGCSPILLRLFGSPKLGDFIFIMIQLRQNQQEPISKAIEFFKSKSTKPSLIVLPTAWGKSILTAFVAMNSDDRLLVLQPSKELLEQNVSKYFALCDGLTSDVGIYSASFRKKEIAKITYATIGSIKNIGEQFRRYGFTKLLIDEAHLYPREADSMLGKFISESGITHVLGITATPVKLQNNTDLDGNRFSKLQMLTNRSKKGNFFKDIIHVGQVQEMVRLGFWSPLRYDVRSFNGDRLEFNSTKSEFTEESVQRAFNDNGGDASVLRVLDENKDRKHVLVFVPSVKDAVELSKIYPMSGVVFGEQDKGEREKTLARFRNGEIRVLFNVRVLSTGFDFTGIDCIVFGISTASLALYYQIIGRATRIDKNKKDALIIDLGGNFERFGRVEDITFRKERQWEMYGSEGRRLSGVPIHELTEKSDSDFVPVVTMPFGKHAGVRIEDVPRSYREWMLNNFAWDKKKENLRKSIIATL